MPKQTIVPLFGSGTLGKSTNVTAQRRINLYAETFPDPDKTPKAFYSRPGLINWATYATSPALPGPFRALWAYQGTFNGRWSVIGAAGSASAASVIQNKFLTSGPGFYRTAAGPMEVAVNQIGVDLEVDGASVYNQGTTGDLFALATNFPLGATSICVIASRFVVNDPAHPGRFYWSPLNYDPSVSPVWVATDFATAEGNPDPLVAVREIRGELVLFGTQSTEFWAPTGASDIFARIGGSTIDWGLAAQGSLRKWNEGAIFLGRNSMGDRQVCTLNGFQAKVVSTPDVDFDINTDPMPDAATALAFTKSGHSFYVLNLQNTSWAYDMTTGRWDEWQTDGGRWAGQFGCAAWGKYLVSDYRNSNVYYLDDTTYTDNGQPMLRRIVSRHAFNNLDQMRLWRLQLDAETGVGLASGQGSDPQVMLKTSKDGGHTWGPEQWRTLGPQGKYLTNAVWLALGSAADWTFDFSVSDPVKVVLMNTAASFGQ